MKIIMSDTELKKIINDAIENIESDFNIDFNKYKFHNDLDLIELKTCYDIEFKNDDN